jgi:hypothetical protein
MLLKQLSVSDVHLLTDRQTDRDTHTHTGQDEAEGWLFYLSTGGVSGAYKRLLVYMNCHSV